VPLAAASRGGGRGVVSGGGRWRWCHGPEVASRSGSQGMAAIDVKGRLPQGGGGV
jgi:hypothetical protein